MKTTEGQTNFCKGCENEARYFGSWKYGHDCGKDVQPSKVDSVEEMSCEHFYLPYKTLHMSKYEQKHDSNNNYRWTDVDFVEKVYCAKCGEIKFTDSI